MYIWLRRYLIRTTLFKLNKLRTDACETNQPPVMTVRLHSIHRRAVCYTGAIRLSYFQLVGSQTVSVQPLVDRRRRKKVRTQEHQACQHDRIRKASSQVSKLLATSEPTLNRRSMSRFQRAVCLRDRLVWLGGIPSERRQLHCIVIACGGDADCVQSS